MSWVSLILAALQLVNGLMGWLKGRQDFKAGEDAEIAKQSVAILKQTENGKLLLAKLTSMSDPEVDDVLKDLGGG